MASHHAARVPLKGKGVRPSCPGPDRPRLYTRDLMAQTTGRTDQSGPGHDSAEERPGRSEGPRHRKDRRSGFRNRAWWDGLGRGVRPLWRPVAVLIAARLAMWSAIFIFSHLFNHYTLNPWDGGWYLLAAR